MATDTTELTFIRCPECRSLIPALSSRCRMCGATINNESKTEEKPPHTTPPTSRVRQQTISSASSEELTNQLNNLRKQEDPSDDPLEEFLKDEEETDSSTTESTVLLEQKSNTDTEDTLEDSSDDLEDLEDLDYLDDDLDSDFEDEQDILEDNQQPQEQTQSLTDNAHTEVTSSSLLKSTLEPEPKEEPSKLQSNDDNRSKPRVVIEQGRGKFSKGLSFSSNKPRFDLKADKEKTPESTDDFSTKEVTESKVSTKEQDMQPKFKNNDQLQTKSVEKPTLSSTTAKDSIKKSDQLGKIYGWLVSYSNPSGESIELREGRFFVSSSQLRSTDLVLNDETISTPHAMFTISTDTGIIIQDLKSERGVFIRENDHTTYHREYDSIVLNHGDWVRFGDLEFLVSIIAHVGAK